LFGLEGAKGSAGRVLAWYVNGCFAVAWLA